MAKKVLLITTNLSPQAHDQVLKKLTNAGYQVVDATTVEGIVNEHKFENIRVVELPDESLSQKLYNKFTSLFSPKK